MSDPISQFMEITGCTRVDVVEALLAAHGNMLDEAVAYFFEHEKELQHLRRHKKRADNAIGMAHAVSAGLAVDVPLPPIPLSLRQPAPAPAEGEQSVEGLVSVGADMCCAIMMFLDLDDIANLSMTCRELYFYGRDPRLWEAAHLAMTCTDAAMFWGQGDPQRCALPVPPPAVAQAIDYRREVSQYFLSVTRWLRVDPARVVHLYDKHSRMSPDFELPNPRSSKSPMKANEADRITAVCSNAALWAVSYTRSKRLTVWDIRSSGKRHRQIEVPRAEISHAEFVKAGRDSSRHGFRDCWVSASKDGFLDAWDLQRSGSPLWSIAAHTRPVHALFVGHDLVVSGGSDNIVRCFRVSELFDRGLPAASQSAVPEGLSFAGNTGQVECLLVDEEHGLVISSGNAKTIHLWQLPPTWSAGPRSGAAPDLNRTQLMGHASLVRDMCWVVAGSVFASASQDNSARVWEITSGECRLVLSRHANFVSHIRAFDSCKLLTACDDRQIRRFDTERGALDCKFSAGPFSANWLEIVNRNVFLAASSRESIVRIYDSRSPRVQSALCPAAAAAVLSVADTRSSSAAPTFASLFDEDSPGGSPSPIPGCKPVTRSAISALHLIGSSLFVGHKDGKLFLYDFRTSLA